MNKHCTVILVGLDNAGKTVLLNNLVNEYSKDNSSYNCRFTINYVTFVVHDLGGIANGPTQTNRFLPNADAIVYVVDAADPQRFEESKSDLLNILAHAESIMKPVLILGNKIDIVTAISESTLIKVFDLTTTGKHSNLHGANPPTRPLEVFMCSASRQVGYVEGFTWLCSYVK